jgi:hypothetical protein
VSQPHNHRSGGGSFRCFWFDMHNSFRGDCNIARSWVSAKSTEPQTLPSSHHGASLLSMAMDGRNR